ncbi:neutral/alkaline non-lysosomal ceramidase N-terminal domain-containing protein [soil metagenome]
MVFRQYFACLFLIFLSPLAASADGTTWKAGVGRAVITPKQPMWLSGYASRTHPSEGKLQDLHAKVLALDDGKGNVGLLITLDLVGITREFSNSLRVQIDRRWHISAANILLSVSHTHSGPAIEGNLATMYALDEKQARLVHEYRLALEANILDAVAKALAGREPVTLSWGIGTADFAVNRRANKEAEVPRLRKEGLLKGPTDHDVPVLAVYRPNRQLLAVAFGYACHATVLDGYLWSSDYPGAAQAALEAAHPGATALFWAGCGADQNPLPRRQAAHVEQYGKALAASVDAVLATSLPELEPGLATAAADIDLPFAALPTRVEIDRNLRSTDRFVAARAKLLLEQIQREGTLRPSYPYPFSVWRLGKALTWVGLGGEVVVDYALRLKKELGPGPVWVTAYANDVMAYIPSRRVLDEGGYEGGGAMVYYGLPASWGPRVEDLIVDAVRTQARKLGK